MACDQGPGRTDEPRSGVTAGSRTRRQTAGIDSRSAPCRSPSASGYFLPVAEGRSRVCRWHGSSGRLELSRDFNRLQLRIANFFPALNFALIFGILFVY